MRFWSLPGLIPYSEARELQIKLVQLRIEDQIPDTVLFLEHRPVITQGRGLQFTGASRPRHMPLPAQIPSGFDFSETERGGDLTYHGPGQLVIYPICKLDGKGFGPPQDVSGFIRKLENVLIQTLIRTLNQSDLKIGIKENATGVWIGDRKIASIGIAVRKWVTFHGAALNCVNDLKPFHLISPCGFSPEVMTRMADFRESGANWRTEIEQALFRQWQEDGEPIHWVRDEAISNYLTH